MEDLYKKILENIDTHIIIKDINNNIISSSSDYALELSSYNENKLKDIHYNNNIYSVVYYKLNEYDIEIYQNINKYYNEISKLKKDYLTNLFNRHAIFEKLNELKNNNSEFSIVMCDIDFFKKVNDSYGHLVGDYVLKLISDILTKNIKDLGMVGRYGGEEFIIILFNNDKKSIFELINKIRIQIQNTKIRIKNSNFIKEFSVTMTFGISMKDSEDIKTLISKADQALYKGKKNGRNQINYY